VVAKLQSSSSVRFYNLVVAVGITAFLFTVSHLWP